MTDKTATKMERELIAGMDPLDQARRLVPNLTLPAEELKGDELGDLLSFRVECAGELIRKLSIEVIRLRLGIGHLHYGQISERDLYEMSKTWNE